MAKKKTAVLNQAQKFVQVEHPHLFYLNDINGGSVVYCWKEDELKKALLESCNQSYEVDAHELWLFPDGSHITCEDYCDGSPQYLCGDEPLTINKTT
jgi:hypothetical protein